MSFIRIILSTQLYVNRAVQMKPIYIIFSECKLYQGYIIKETICITFLLNVHTIHGYKESLKIKILCYTMQFPELYHPVIDYISYQLT